MARKEEEKCHWTIFIIMNKYSRPIFIINMNNIFMHFIQVNTFVNIIHFPQTIEFIFNFHNIIIFDIGNHVSIFQ